MITKARACLMKTERRPFRRSICLGLITLVAGLIGLNPNAVRAEMLAFQAGKPFPAWEYTFRTVKRANGTPAATPAEQIPRTCELLTAESLCPGDAPAKLMSLRPEFAESEAVLRLKLALFGQLSLQDDYKATEYYLK